MIVLTLFWILFVKLSWLSDLSPLNFFFNSLLKFLMANIAGDIWQLIFLNFLQLIFRLKFFYVFSFRYNLNFKLMNKKMWFIRKSKIFAKYSKTINVKHYLLNCGKSNCLILIQKLTIIFFIYNKWLIFPTKWQIIYYKHMHWAFQRL